MSIFSQKRIDRGSKFEKMEFPNETSKRDAEEQLLKPESIEPYAGELPKHTSELESRTALIVFRDKQQMDLIGSLFNIRESCAGKTYITNIELLESIAQGVIDKDLYVKDGRVYVAPHSVIRATSESSVSNTPSNTVTDKE